jgi:hypothetical protein
MYDVICNENKKNKQLSVLQNIVKEWVSDDNGVNILYKSNGDDRYPGFKLYKMIARSVHKHIPKNVIHKSYFQEFIYKSKNIINEIKDELFVNIDHICV